jgi:hypothetical protein
MGMPGSVRGTPPRFRPAAKFTAFAQLAANASRFHFLSLGAADTAVALEAAALRLWVLRDNVDVDGGGHIVAALPCGHRFRRRAKATTWP